jgi:two-component system cell cycle response regulator
MRKSERALSVAPVIAGGALITLMAVAIGVAGQIGLWLVAVLGGTLLGILVALAAVGVAGVNKSVRIREHASLIDPVTHLPNSDKLLDDLATALDDHPERGRIVLSFYLLDGIKKYTDAYGRACGDVLLRWLGRKLKDAVGDDGTAYRMRGGEFAAIARGDQDTTARVRAAAAAALIEFGEGFVITCAVGEAVLHEEAESTSEALKLADHRAQARRKAAAAELGQQPPENAAEAVRSIVPRFDVAGLATAVASAMDYPPELLDDLAAAAHLRDIGNMAVPSIVLAHTRDLAAEEWQFIHLHTLVGERLLAANFGMEDVAALVRSSHERWDGDGYPDGLRGDEIPLGARILFVCSAFEDMTSSRPHRSALEVDDAFAELDRGAGAQFDPQVVRAFREAFPAGDEPVLKAAAGLRTQRLRVLVAEDDPASRFLLWRGVEAAGHECVTVENGHDALVVWRRELPDVVISDSRLPDLDGNELCRQIRSRPDSPYTHFVMIAALGDLGRIRGGIGAGADDFLTKPIVRDELDMRLLAAARAVSMRAGKQQRAAR